MYVLSILKEGFGNKLFMLMAYINKFRKLSPTKDDILYVVETVSKHDTGSPREKFGYVFPGLKELPWLKFIGWSEYDKLKGGEHTEFMVDFLFDKEDFISLRPLIKKYFKMNPVYDQLLEKYDTKKGIALHVRLGDKFNINFNRLNNGMKEDYLLMSPRYFIDETRKLLAEKKGPVYIFSDSPTFAECLLRPELPQAILINEKCQDTFFLLTKFKRAVLSESTLGLAAGYMHFLKHQYIIPSYRVKVKRGDLTESKYVDAEYFTLETDRTYKLMAEDYKPIHKLCSKK